MRNKIKKYINNNIYSSSTITKIEQNINYNNPEELYFFGKYLFLYLKNFPDSEISKKTEHYLHEAYYNWKNRNTKLYANLNKLITQFYLKYNKFNDANTFLLNYFNTVGEKNIKEAWPWRYRFKIFYETKIYFIYKKPEKFLKWLENAYKIEKKNGSNHISLNIYKDFQKNLNKKFKSEEDNFYNKIQNLNFIFLKKLERKESAYIEGEYTFSNKKTSAEKDSKTEIQHDKLKRKKYKKKLNKLN